MKTILLLLITTFSGLAFGQKTTTLKGHIRNPKAEMIYLTSYILESGRIAGTIYHDSCLIDNGNFKLSAKLDSLTLMYFWHGGEHSWVYMKPGEKLQLSLNTDFFDETVIFTGDGAERNHLMTQITTIMEKMKLSKDILIGKFKNDPESDTIPLINGLGKIDSTFYDFIDSELASFPEVKRDLEYIKERNTSITKGYINSARRHIAFLEMEKKELGSPFLDAAGIDLDGKDVKISDHFGQITVLDFWATWCVPCKAEFPALHELEKKYQNKVTFLGIASLCKKEDWRKMAKKEGFHNNIYLTEESMNILSEKYSIQTIPRYIILDAEGNVVDSDASRPSSGLENQLKELLK